MIKKWKNSEKMTNDISEVLILLKLDSEKMTIAFRFNESIMFKCNP
jgi:hypothetical protein